MTIPKVFGNFISLSVTESCPKDGELSVLFGKGGAETKTWIASFINALLLKDMTSYNIIFHYAYV